MTDNDPDAWAEMAFRHMMAEDLMQAYEKQKCSGGTLVIKPMPGQPERLASGIIELDDGIAFADVGWKSIGTHPFHRITGEIHGEGPWTIGTATIRELESDDPKLDQWRRWLDQVRADPELGYDGTEKRLRNNFT